MPGRLAITSAFAGVPSFFRRVMPVAGNKRLQNLVASRAAGRADDPSPGVGMRRSGGRQPFSPAVGSAKCRPLGSTPIFERGAERARREREP